MSDHAEILEQAASWRHAGKGVALATVVKTWGSSPRPAGAKLAVADSGVQRRQFISTRNDAVGDRDNEPPLSLRVQRGKCRGQVSHVVLCDGHIQFPHARRRTLIPPTIDG